MFKIKMHFIFRISFFRLLAKKTQAFHIKIQIKETKVRKSRNLGKKNPKHGLKH